jgi:hypothetical protein
MAVKTFRVRNFHAAENELAPGNQLMNVIANANMNHARRIKFKRKKAKKINNGASPFSSPRVAIICEAGAGGARWNEA